MQVQLGSLDGRRFAAQELKKPIWFGEVAVGARQQRVVRVCNPTPLPLPFCWQQTDDPVSSGKPHLLASSSKHHTLLQSPLAGIITRALLQTTSWHHYTSLAPCYRHHLLASSREPRTLLQSFHCSKEHWFHAGPQDAQHELTDGQFGAMQFHAAPAVGILEAGSETDMTLSFAPDSPHRYICIVVWRQTARLCCWSALSSAIQKSTTLQDGCCSFNRLILFSCLCPTCLHACHSPIHAIPYSPACFAACYKAYCLIVDSGTCTYPTVSWTQRKRPWLVL